MTVSCSQVSTIKILMHHITYRPQTILERLSWSELWHSRDTQTLFLSLSLALSPWYEPRWCRMSRTVHFPTLTAQQPISRMLNLNETRMNSASWRVLFVWVWLSISENEVPWDSTSVCVVCGSGTAKHYLQSMYFPYLLGLAQVSRKRNDDLNVAFKIKERKPIIKFKLSIGLRRIVFTLELNWFWKKAPLLPLLLILLPLLLSIASKSKSWSEIMSF